MSLIIRGGTVVNADQSFTADVYCEDGIIQAVGADMDASDIAYCTWFHSGGSDQVDGSLYFKFTGGLLCQ